LRQASELVRSERRWTAAVYREPRRVRSGERFAIGVLPGEGVGPDVTAAALAVLSAVEGSGSRFTIATGGPIGRDAELLSGRALTEGVEGFCAGVFEGGGAVLAGPGGSRFVYDLRRRFDLFVKLSPLRPFPALHDAGRLKGPSVAGADILIVRENVGGEYLGDWSESVDARHGRVSRHSFHYAEDHVRRLLGVAAQLAASRSGRLAVAIKDGGLPTVSSLWRDVARETAAASGVALRVLDIDLAAYLLMQEPLAFDVLAASNLFGDVLADLGAVLLSSRGMSFSGNFSEGGAAVYQTTHGSALDLAGKDRANPIGQISSLAMMLRESFGLHREAAWIEEAIADVLHLGFRTFDVAGDGTTVVGTEEMGRRIAASVERRARRTE
jgi:3-isopropylmalate dehydrogenase